MLVVGFARQDGVAEAWYARCLAGPVDCSAVCERAWPRLLHAMGHVLPQTTPVDPTEHYITRPKGAELERLCENELDVIYHYVTQQDAMMFISKMLIQK